MKPFLPMNRAVQTAIISRCGLTMKKTFMELETFGDDIRIAIVDDDLVIRQLVKTVFQEP